MIFCTQTGLGIIVGKCSILVSLLITIKQRLRLVLHNGSIRLYRLTKRKQANQPDDVFPYVLVFSNGIAKDNKRIEEIAFWFQGNAGAYLLWAELRNRETIKEHFDNYIKPKID